MQTESESIVTIASLIRFLVVFEIILELFTLNELFKDQIFVVFLMFIHYLPIYIHSLVFIVIFIIKLIIIVLFLNVLVDVFIAKRFFGSAEINL